MPEPFQGRCIEVGHVGLAMESGHEGGDRIALDGRDIAGKLRLEQRQIALLRILPRLRPLIAQPVEAGSRLDPGKMIDDIRYDCAHGLLTFRLLA